MSFQNWTLGMFAAAMVLSPCARAEHRSCASLVGMRLGAGVVLSAEPLSAGQKLSLPGAASAIHIAPLATAACRVKAHLVPVPTSDINVEVWLPESWNGKLVGTGGGGFSGGLDSATVLLRPLVDKGYVGAATDVGHPASDGAQWAYKQPVKLVDWAHRGNHVTAVFAKALIAAYYGTPARRAYFQGCSNGGRDALMEASRYPKDYDGIIAGAPAAAWTRIMSEFAWNTRAVAGPPHADLSPHTLKRVSDAVLAHCDTLDGVKDGLLEDPRACRFDPAELQCKSAEAHDCLSASQVTALRAIYAGPHTRDGRQISAGMSLGGEEVEWAPWITDPKSRHRQFATEFFRWMVYGDETWSLDHFDLERDYATAASRMGPILDADNPDLKVFMRHGGKLILYHGWADAALPPGNTIAYYQALTKRDGASAAQSRLFMAPGMAHCFGGAGPSQFDMLDALDAWFETGTAPERVVATQPENPLLALAGLPTKTVRTRPLCAWPQRAHWNGSGSADEAANFSCVDPK